MSDIIGDEDFDDSVESDDDENLDSPDFVGEDGEPEAEEEVKEEPKAKVKPRAESRADQTTPQVSPDKIDAKLVQRYQMIRQALGKLNGESADPDSAAAELAQIWHKEFEELTNKSEKMTDDLYFATPEGQQVQKIMKLAGNGITKEAAMNLVREGTKQMQVESAKAGKRTESGPRLDDHYRKVAKIFKLSEKDMLAELGDLSKGKHINMLDGKGGKGFEVVIDV